MRATWINAGEISPLHGVLDFAKLADLKASLRADGWQGRPILVIETADGLRGLTGSHRVEAAQQIGMEIPVLMISADEAEAADLDADYLCATDDDDRKYRLRRSGLTEAADLMDAENN